MSFKRVTILLSDHNVPKKWLYKALRSLPENLQVQLFFVDSGTLLVGEKLEKYSLGDCVYCTYSHRILQGPPPIAGIAAGGLLDLGAMIGRSEYTISFPRTILPAKPVDSPLKKIAVILDSDNERGVEGLRIATGLAGCNHRVDVFFTIDGFSVIDGVPDVPRQAAPYIEFLTSLGTRFHAPPDSYEVSDYDVLISV